MSRVRRIRLIRTSGGGRFARPRAKRFRAIRNPSSGKFVLIRSRLRRVARDQCESRPYDRNSERGRKPRARVRFSLRRGGRGDAPRVSRVKFHRVECANFGKKILSSRWQIVSPSGSRGSRAARIHDVLRERAISSRENQRKFAYGLKGERRDAAPLRSLGQ